MQLAKYWQNCRTVAWTRWTHGAVFAKRRAFLPTNVEIMTDIEPEKTLWLSARTPGLRIRRHSLARNTTGTRPAPRSEQYLWVGIPLILFGAQYHCTMCTLGSMFSFQPNKLRHILKFILWYIIQQIFVPTCSVGRKTWFSRKPWFSNFKGLASYCKAKTTFTFHFSIINA